MRLRHLLPLLTLTLGLLLTSLLSWRVNQGWRIAQAAERAEAAVVQLGVALRAAEMVSRERGPTNGALGAVQPPTPAVVQALREARDRTDLAWRVFGAALVADANAAREREAAARLQDAGEALAQARAAVDRLLALPLDAREPQAIRSAVAGMVAVVPMLAPAVELLVHDATQGLPRLSDAVQGARLTAELREYTGLLGSHFTAPLARREPFTPAERAAIERTRGRIDQLRALVELRVRLPGQDPSVVRGWQMVEEHYFTGADELLGQVMAAGQTDGAYGMDPAAFAARYVPAMNTLFGLRDQLLVQAAAITQAELQKLRTRLQWGASASVLLLALLAATVVVLYRRVLGPLRGVTLALDGLTRGDFNAPLPQPRANDEIAAVIGAVARLQEVSRDRQQLEADRQVMIEQLRTQSSTDFLTGLPNRRAFVEAAERELARARRSGNPLVAVLLDIDHFKQFNDRYGHNAGDHALLGVAQTLRLTLRAGDLVARYGGEEFVLLVQGDLAVGLAFAERLRAAIAQVRVATPDGGLQGVSASLGVADSPQFGLLLDALLLRADEAMYRAKALGRDQVVVAESLGWAS